MKSPAISDLSRYAWIVALAGAIATAALAVGHTQTFFQSYLLGWLYAASAPFGALGLLLMYLLVGGQWGRPLRRILAAMTATLPWASILFIPVLVGLRYIYPWATESTASLGPHKAWYLTSSFFIGRTVFYFLALNGLAFWSLRNIREELAMNGPAPGSRRAGSLGIVAYFLILSFAAYDWTLSLAPHWFSSVYPAICIMSYVLSGLALTIVVFNWLKNRYPDRFHIEPDIAQDVGNLLLAFTMFWTYVSLSQYLIIWSGNLPEEISWYIARRGGGWRYLATFLFCGQFGYTFALLLSSYRKRAMERLTRVAFWVLAIRILDVFWIITPDYHPGRIIVHGLDVSLLVALGALWSVYFFNRLKKEAAL